MYLYIVIASLCVHLSLSETAEKKGESLARGFNDNIAWLNHEDGIKLAKDVQKPIMILFHKSWCGACKALKPQVTNSKELEEASKDFVMINIQDDEGPDLDKYMPDGGYIPRILFLGNHDDESARSIRVNTAGLLVDHQGSVQKDLFNQNGNKQYKYFYPSADDIVKSMKRAKDQLSATGSQGGEL